MSHPLIPRQHVELNFTELDDTDAHTLVAGVKQASASSQIVANSPAMQSSLAALLAKDTALVKATGDVNNDRAKLKTDLATEATCRSDLHSEIRTYATLAEGCAKNAADLESAGLTARQPAPKKTTPPDAPTSIDVLYPKHGHGKATASVHDTGKPRHSYVAQWSPDPVTASSWSALGVGFGKTRALTGESGTRVWVRFAAVRGQVQSDWSPPALVVFP